MVVCVYAVKDRKAAEFLFPVTFKNDSMAVRFFKGLLDGDKFAKHKEDYSIWLIGEWNTETGMLTPMVTKDVTPYSELEVISNG